MKNFRIWTNIEFMAIKYNLTWGHILSWGAFLYYTKFVMDEHKKYTETKEFIYKKNYSYYTQVFNKKMIVFQHHAKGLILIHFLNIFSDG